MNTLSVRNIPSVFLEMAEKRKDKIAMRQKDLGIWNDVSWEEYKSQALRVAYGLMKLGVHPGDFVGIIGDNSPEWLYADMGIQLAGAASVGIYTTSSFEQLFYILQHAGCKVLFADNEEQVDKWLMIRDRLPSLQYIVYWDKKGLEKLDDENLIFFDDLKKMGQKAFSTDRDKHLKIANEVNPDDVSILVYTSGTTGHPKGAMITAKNIFWIANAIIDSTSELISEEETTMSFLPLCHIFERLFSVYLPLVYGYTIHFAESTETIAQNLREIRPTIGYAVPRVWEKFHSSILLKMKDAPLLNQWMFKKAISIGERYTRLKLDGKKIPVTLQMLRWISYYCVLYPLKYMMGMNNMKNAISGAAPISREILFFYHILGIRLLEGYGMTESTGIITISDSSFYKLGTVGIPLKGAQLSLDSEGEILVRHGGVFKGYYQDEEATAKTIKEGWLYTGDIGEVDMDGFLKIVDRKKDIIITAGGKNIAPQYIENKMKESPYINDAIVIGDGKKYITAIVILDEENINKYASDQKIQYSSYSELASNSDIKLLIEKEIQKVNKALSNVEMIKKFSILDKRLYVEDGEVTPTMKVKRKFINEHYTPLIEAMYR
ncbi:MAG TPA: long-chain fatty acid--CoA ligase [Saprospiraceae bacterium]|nr:long-chain fatty acid--CoA ligase [Saprospiraceae bacterium]